MKYILIKKKYGNDNANLSDILREYLESNYNIEPGENTIIIDDCKVQYSFSNNKDDNRCFFTLSSDERIYSNAKCLEYILEDIKRSGLLPYFHFLKVYDGLSEYYCKKLYPLYAAYERKVRYMILLMVTRSYGDKWIDNTIDDDTKTSISEKARSGFSNINMDEVLEYFDLAELENYLFLPPKVDTNNYLHNELTDEKMESLDKDKICSLIRRVNGISRATVDPMFDERQFDLVMFDEVSMAYVPQVIAAAALAREKFMCVGDFKQLAPISQNQAARILQVDIFSYLRIVDEKGNMFWHPWLVMLNEQRRMAPAISEFPSKFIYKGLLKDNSVVLTGQNKKKNDVVINKQPLAKDALNLVDMAGTYCAADKNTDGSRFNILSAVISFSTAVNAQNNNIDDVGIITPYAAQVRLIRAMLRDYYAKDIPSIRCATVHQFQGTESDVIVFDAVESYPKGAVGYLMGKEPNQVTRLINVAITRGKGKVIVVANARFWENIFKGRNHVFYRLLQHIKNKNHQVVEYQDKTLQPYVESINPGKVVDIFVDEQDAIAKFEQDMLKAKWKVVISLPSGALRETENQVFKLIDDADSRGVDILMKSNDYASLPQHWKNYCRGTENATFPLIIIDDEVSWYGLPTANWKFDVDKTTSLKTVVYMMVRFKGKNTVEMLKALTDIETVAIGVNTRKLLKKDNNMVTHPMASSSGVVVPDDGKSAYGLAGFVEEKEFCPACKSHMVLTKNARGTAYLKCSNKACKETKYLTVDLMNWYISSHNVGCPKHDGGELKGRLGKYGPYVTCTCGHTLKPHDI